MLPECISLATMKGSHVSAFTVVISLYYLQAFVAFCETQPQFEVGSENMKMAVGETLTLACNFSEPVPGDYRVLWKAETVVIGRCPQGNGCQKEGRFFFDTRITLAQREEQGYQLIIVNISFSDGGSYICGVDQPFVFASSFQSLHTVEVSILSSSTATESAEIDLKTSPQIMTNSSENSQMTTTPFHNSAMTTKDGEILPTPRLNQSDNLGTTERRFLQDETGSTQAHQSMVYYCAVVSTFGLIFAVWALWRTKSWKARSGSSARNQLKHGATNVDNKDLTPPACDTDYEAIEQSGFNPQENEIYHNIDGQTQESSLDLQPPQTTASQGSNLPRIDPSIPADMKPNGQQQYHNSSHHVIDIL